MIYRGGVHPTKIIYPNININYNRQYITVVRFNMAISGMYIEAKAMANSRL